MLESRDRFFESIKKREVCFIGLGVAHINTIKLFANKGISVTLCERKDKEKIEESLYSELKTLGVKFNLGENYLENINSYDIVFRTPGMYYNLPILQEYKNNGGTLTGEMEVFCSLCPCPVFAVTGSDGKTTTTTLISQILKTDGKTVHLGGNIGKALLPEIFNIRQTDYAAVELSSFQLISMRYAPYISVITNVSPNHLDVHANMQEYTNAKKEIFIHQDAFGKTVLNMDNDITASFAKDVRGECIWFSMEQPVKNGVWYNKDDNCIYSVSYKNGSEKIMDANKINLPGTHNIANFLAAICAVREHVSKESIIKVAETFGGVEHRIEFVKEIEKVKYYNDSIATTPTRVVAGLRSFDKKIIMIAGGYDKKIPFAPLAPEIIKHVKILILMGNTAQKIENAVKENTQYSTDNPQIIHVENLEQAVMKAKNLAQENDIVSLSPACASYDMYKNFEKRGEHFKRIVNNL